MRLAKELNNSFAAGQTGSAMEDHSAHLGHNMAGHGAVDHSAHNMMGHSMSMSFNFDLNQTVLFSFWQISTVGGETPIKC